ncbi:4Fe-4S binding protein [Adlercreutzia sp. R25]|uniref:ATP-binding protein n=1 Tax=Adlercreutzia shanghongiae TaxID=3111773 RepID=UPI002DBAF96C|nr:4Fe-4S binding protein [Adlercreutzia sp. R25]MEC4273109.1 4Fe-4S binding protein [Adlercreutzia sp. R25]
MGAWESTPEAIARLGASTMPLSELNRRRRAYIDAQAPWVNGDGTVVPSCYVKMRALIHTMGYGAGRGLNDEMFRPLQRLFTEQEAEAYLQLPWGVEFTVEEFFEKSQAEGADRSREECAALCERFSAAGFLPFHRRARGLTYSVPGFAEGVNTYAYNDTYFENPRDCDWPCLGEGLAADHARGGTPAYSVIPLGREIMAEGSDLLAFDDAEALLRKSPYIAVQPCSCRYEQLVYECQRLGESFPTFADFARGDLTEFQDRNGDRIETCLALGDDAEYLVSLGLARRIDADEALAIFKRARDDGAIIHGLYGQNHAWLCFCNPKVCGILAQWEAGAQDLGGWDALADLPAFAHRSSYELVFHRAQCRRCGLCAARCPTKAIRRDGEGLPVLANDHLCHRCGQCALICPAKARALTPRREEDRLVPPRDMLEDYNQKAAYRFEHGLID